MFARLCFLTLGLTVADLARAATLPRDLGREGRAYGDPVTGLTVTELTGPEHPADNLYFHF